MLSLFAVGRLRDGPEAELFARYNTRLRPKFAVTEIAEARGSPAEVKRREGEALLAALPNAAFVVALDLGGTHPTAKSSHACWNAGSLPGDRSAFSSVAPRDWTRR